MCVWYSSISSNSIFKSLLRFPDLNQQNIWREPQQIGANQPVDRPFNQSIDPLEKPWSVGEIHNFSCSITVKSYEIFIKSSVVRFRLTPPFQWDPGQFRWTPLFSMLSWITPLTYFVACRFARRSSGAWCWQRRVAAADVGHRGFPGGPKLR